jgi:hypothetical protein
MRESKGQECQSRLAAHQAIPEGYVLVPKEPTQAMVDAGGFSANMNHATYPALLARYVYSAMIAAAPQAQPAGVPQQGRAGVPEGGGSAVDGVRGDAEVQYHWSDERLEFLRKQSNGSGSLAAQQAYINGLEFELQRALGVLASAPVDELAMLRRDLERLPKSPGKEDALRHMAELERAIASGVPPSPMPQLMERALAAMQEVQERAEPGFAPDIAIIPADDWRAFIDAHAEVQMLWAAWRDSPDGAKGSGHG